MKVTVLYFASLREERQCTGEAIALSGPMKVYELFEHIFSRPPTGLRFAINQCYVSEDTQIEHGDEIAFIPPLGGG